MYVNYKREKIIRLTRFMWEENGVIFKIKKIFGQQNNHENHVSEEHNFIWEISHNKLINRIQNNMFPSHTPLKVNS